MIYVFAIARPGGTVANNTAIEWELVDDSVHEPSFITDLVGSSTGLAVQYPNTKNVVNFMANCDETFAENGVFFGASVSTSQATLAAFRKTVGGMIMTGNGTTWTTAGTFKRATTITVSSGKTTLVPFGNNLEIEASSTGVQYVGRNNYRIELDYGGANTKFWLVDIDTNTRITTAPTSDDLVLITNYGLINKRVDLENWKSASDGNYFLDDNQINIWMHGFFELWLKVWVVSDTSLRPRWQTKSGVTTYKLYRDINEDFSTETLIYSGTNLEYLDTGLTADTLYYYRLDDQSDTEISRFWIKTKV